MRKHPTDIFSIVLITFITFFGGAALPATAAATEPGTPKEKSSTVMAESGDQASGEAANGLALPATNPAEMESAAAKAYADRDYERAISLYEELAQTNGVSPGLYYDLGTAAARKGDLGLARLSLERARRLDPQSSQIRRNLDYVSNRVNDANRASMKGERGSVDEDPVGFLGRVHRSIAADHRSDYWSLFGWISFILILGSVALYLFPSNVAARKVGFFSAIIFTSFTLIFLTFAFMADKESRQREYGVVTAYKIELSAEPDSGSKSVSSPLTQGSKVRVIGEEADAEGQTSWYKVRLNSNYVGWLPVSDLEII